MRHQAIAFHVPFAEHQLAFLVTKKTSLARARDTIYHIDEKIPKAQEQSAEKCLFSQLESLNDFIYLVNGIYSRSEAVSRVAF